MAAIVIPAMWLAACMEPPQTTEFPPCASADDLAAREAILEGLMQRMEELLGPEGVRDMWQAHADHQKSRQAVLKSLPQLMDEADYYRSQCDYTDALINMLEIGLSE